MRIENVLLKETTEAVPVLRWFLELEEKETGKRVVLKYRDAVGKEWSVISISPEGTLYRYGGLPIGLGLHLAPDSTIIEEGPF